MPTYIKTGFWEKARKGYKEWLNLDQLITNIVTPLIPPTSTYKVYTALLTQFGEDAPTAVVLQNTLGGNIVWSRYSEGVYEATLIGAFVENKTFTLINSTEDGEDNGVDASWSKRVSDDKVGVRTSSGSLYSQDNRLQSTSFEIRVYN
jgi:hypothetical protein